MTTTGISQKKLVSKKLNPIKYRTDTRKNKWGHNFLPGEGKCFKKCIETCRSYTPKHVHEKTGEA